MIKRYFEYLKDNPEGYWFKRKAFGWGWVPAKWQGWVTLFVFIALLFLNSFRHDLESGSVTEVRTFLLESGALIIILILICWRTGEPPRWQWGFPSKKGQKSEKK